MENNCSSTNTNTIAKPGAEAETKSNDNTTTATVIREHEQTLSKEPPNVSAPLMNGEAAPLTNGEAASLTNGVQDVDDEEEEEGSDMVDDDEEEEEELGDAPARNSPARTPFTNLSQMDADLALARTLQEQERAYMMLSRVSMSMNEETDWVGASYDENDDDFDDPDDVTDEDEFDEEGYGESEGEDGVDAFDVHAHANDEDDNHNDDGPDLGDDAAAFSSDEAYARALQDAEEREMAARLFALAGINERGVEFVEHHGGHSQDTWEEVDPDELSYEELLALGEVVGTESRGLSADTIANLPSVIYKTGSNQSGTSDSCVVCRLDFEDEEAVTVLSCKHSYHAECINNWLKINKVCPVCSAEVSTSGGSQASS